MPDSPADRTVFLGLARNCEPSLPRLLDRVTQIGERLSDWGYVFLESDSYDGTLRLLHDFDRRHQRGVVRGYGRIRRQHPHRTERFAYLRNETLRWLRESPRFADFDLAIVLDMDEVNHDLDPSRVVDLLHEQPRDWAGLFANQSDRYYDVWALRHEEWSPDDCWARVDGRPAGMSREEGIERFVESRMIRLDPAADRVKVDSAFGGLGVYDLAAIAECTYSGLTSEGEPVCEHVPFHRQVRARGGLLFIEPSLINSAGRKQRKRSLLSKGVAITRELFRRKPPVRGLD